MREIAEYDPARYEAIVNRALVEVLFAYEARLRIRELEAYRHQELIFVLGGTKDKTPPVQPAILREDD